jgi:protocatechuate 3,4-dioxygenase, alpha subunit
MTGPERTPSQTIGPFFHNALLRQGAHRTVLTDQETPGEAIRIEGHLYDGDGQPVPDAMVEIWQADHEGRYNHPADRKSLPLDAVFVGFGRTATDEEGAFRFETIKPGPVPFGDGRLQAPHISVVLLGRGLLSHLYTRLYFSDDPATVDDPVLQHVPSERRETLVAKRVGVDGTAVYRFDIALQGVKETVFFAF